MEHTLPGNTLCPDFLMPVQSKQYMHFSKRIGGTWILTGAQLFYYPKNYYSSHFFSQMDSMHVQAEFAVKKYKSHRRCGPELMMSLDILVD